MPPMPVGPARRSLSRLLVKSVLIVAWAVGLLISLLQVAYDLHQVRQLPAENLATVRGMTKEPLDAIVYSMDKDRASDLLTQAGLAVHMVEIGGRGHGRQKRFGWRLGTGGSVGQNESPHQCQRWRKHQGAGRLFLGPTA